MSKTVRAMKSAGQSSSLRWVLPALSFVPVIIGIAHCRSVTGPGDQIMEAGMELAFFFFPISFSLALACAIIANRRQKDWSSLDRAVGLAPFLLFSAAIMVVLMLLSFGG